MDSKIVVKIKYGEDTRRISVDLPLNIKQLFGILQEIFPSLAGQFSVKYVDEDNDYITISSDLELTEALNVATKQQNNVLRLFIFDKTGTAKPTTAEEPKATPSASSTSSQNVPPAFPFGNLFSDPNIANPLFSQLFANPQLFNVVPQLLNNFAANPQLWNAVPNLVQSILGNLNAQQNSTNNNNAGNSGIPKEVTDLLQQLGLGDNDAVKDALNQAFNSPLVKDVLPQVAARVGSFCQSATQPASTPAAAPAQKPTHHGILCDACENTPVGARYKCTVCADYDLCETCEAKKGEIHDPSHTFTKIDSPRAARCPFFAQQQSDKPIHFGITCDACHQHPIVGNRFKCTICSNYDLCEACEAKKTEVHNADHVFLKISSPIRRRWGHGGCRGWGASQDEKQAVHWGVRCDGCNKSPITGIRFKCNTCADYDLCETCEARKAHGTDHSFSKIPFSAPHRWGHGRRWCHQQQQQQQEGNNNNPNFGGWGRCPGRFGPWGGRHFQSQQQPQAARPLGRFVGDITIPDGSIMEPGQSFVKIWRLRNEGTAAWEPNSCLTFVGGDAMSSVDTVVVPGTVEPGQDVDLTVDMTAPSKPGRYVGYWRLQMPDGTRFGQRVWVDIFVKETVPTPVPAPTPAVATEESAPSAPPASPQVELRKEEVAPVVEIEQPKELPQPLQPEVVPTTPLYPMLPVPVPSAPAVEPAPTPVPTPAPVAPVVTAEDPAELKQLLDMGFSNRELNIRLLEKNKYNMLRTVQDLLAL